MAEDTSTTTSAPTAANVAIISEQEHLRIRALLDDPNRRTNRAARTYLLSGMAVCGRCGTKMWSQRRAEYDTRRYLCRSGIDFGGCGRMSIRAEFVEDLICRRVLMRLDSTELADALKGRHRSTTESLMISEAIATDEQRLKEIAVMWANGEMDAIERRAPACSTSTPATEPNLPSSGPRSTWTASARS